MKRKVKIENENFTSTERIVYGVIYPLFVIVVCIIAEYLEKGI